MTRIFFFLIINDKFWQNIYRKSDINKNGGKIYISRVLIKNYRIFKSDKEY